MLRGKYCCSNRGARWQIGKDSLGPKLGLRVGEFQNVPSKLLAWTNEKSHWLHLYFFFLQSEFSNAFSYCLHEQMQSYIGCIWTIFLQNGFSNVFSSGPPEQMNNRICCICTIFLTRVNFQMRPQTACINRCIVALVAFVGFFSRVSF